MPVYKITDPQTGRTMKVQGDAPPTDADIDELFHSQPSVSHASATDMLHMMHQPSIPETKEKGADAPGFVDRLNSTMQGPAHPGGSEYGTQNLLDLSASLGTQALGAVPGTTWANLARGARNAAVGGVLGAGEGYIMSGGDPERAKRDALYGAGAALGIPTVWGMIRSKATGMYGDLAEAAEQRRLAAQAAAKQEAQAAKEAQQAEAARVAQNAQADKNAASVFRNNQYSSPAIPKRPTTGLGSSAYQPQPYTPTPPAVAEAEVMSAAEQAKQTAEMNRKSAAEFRARQSYGSTGPAEASDAVRLRQSGGGGAGKNRPILAPDAYRYQPPAPPVTRTTAPVIQLADTPGLASQVSRPGVTGDMVREAEDLAARNQMGTELRSIQRARTQGWNGTGANTDLSGGAKGGPIGNVWKSQQGQITPGAAILSALGLGGLLTGGKEVYDALQRSEMLRQLNPFQKYADLMGQEQK